MNLAQALQTSFALLEAAWPAEPSRHLVRALAPASATHVVVHRQVDGRDLYYLVGRKAALDLLILGGTVGEALGLHEADATPTVDVAAALVDAPPRAVVFAEGQVAGFFDRDLLTMGGGTRGEGGAPALAADGGAVEVPRSLVAEMPESVAINDVVSLLVSLTAAPAAAGASLPLTLAVGSAVDIVVQPRAGLAVEGRREASITVSDEAESLPVQFKLRGTAIGPTQARVLAFREGQPLGALTLSVQVTAATASAEAARATQELAPVSAQRPDLSLLIFADEEEGQTELTFRLTAADPGENLSLTELGRKRLSSDPGRYFAEFFSDIENLALDTPEQRRDAALMVAAKGANLFNEVFPPEVRDVLWRLRDRITSVQVASQEPFIPWEICRLSGQEAGRVVDGPFLCEAFNITRWPLGMGQRPRLRLGNMAIVVPADSGLSFAQEERDYLLGLAGAGRSVKEIPASFGDVLRELASGQYDGWHFSGHGAVRSQDPNRSALYLTGNTPFTPEALSGAATNLGLARPLVFLNACQAGRGGLTLTDIGGWGQKFLAAGAAAFVGTYWAVTDRPALEFARAFYGRLLTGMAIGQAAKEARAAIKAEGHPTWLAYTVFADPWATVG